jgi:hypothetical protein
MAFEFSPSTSVNPQSFTAPQSNPASGSSGNLLSTLGNMITIGQQQQNLAKSKATFEADVKKANAEADTAEIGTKRAEVGLGSDQLAFNRRQLESAAQQQQKLFTKPDLNADDIIKATVQHAKDFNLGPDAVKQALQGLPEKGTTKDYQAYLAGNLASTLSAQSQMDKLYPASTLTNVGGAIVPTATGNQAVTGVAPGSQTGQAIPTTISPQIFANPITGNPQVIGGGRPAGNQPQMGGTNTVALNSMGTSGTNVQLQAKPQAQPQRPVTSQISDQLTPGENESPANFNARVARSQNAVVKAQDQFNNPNSEFGHIPTIKTLNNNILTALKDPSVDTGAIQSFIAGKTKQENLSAKEQKLAKDLAQRVQNLSPKTDADAENKRKAYGSLELKKEALSDLIRQDNAWVTTQELYAKGILNNSGTPTNPTFGKGASFENDFAKLTQNPALMKYISIVGEGQGKVSLDADDIKALQKDLGSMSPQKRQELELQRQTLLKLVNGGK